MGTHFWIRADRAGPGRAERNFGPARADGPSRAGPIFDKYAKKYQQVHFPTLTREGPRLGLELWDVTYIFGKLRKRWFQIYTQFLFSRTGIREKRGQSFWKMTNYYLSNKFRVINCHFS